MPASPLRSGPRTSNGGSRLEMPKPVTAKSRSQSPQRLHSEEVELADNEGGVLMSSTTGRRLQAVDTSPQEPSSSTSPNGDGRRQRQGSSPSPRATAIKPQCFDIHGFRVTEAEKAAERKYLQDHAPSQSELKKWRSMTQSWDSWSRTSLSIRKTYCRKGIPQKFRAKTWQLLLGTLAASSSSTKRARYEELKKKPLDSPDLAGIIERDLDRTFPTHCLFEEGGTKEGQGMLRNILYAYANYNTLVGYCQGMGFLAATLLLQIEEEEDTFWAFCALMEKPPYQFEGLYEPGFPQLRCCFYVLDRLLKRQSKQLYQRTKDFSVDPSFYATHWFLTAFSYYLNFDLVSRIWDMFLCEGWKPIYRVALALLLLEQPLLMAKKTESDLLLALKDVQEKKNPDELLAKALSVKFKTSRVAKFTKAFRAK